MAWEWHNRHRGPKGRFAKHLQDSNQQQFHVRMSGEAAEIVRKRAGAAGEEIGQYIKRAVAMRIKSESGQLGQAKTVAGDG